MPAVSGADEVGMMKAPPPFSYVTYGKRQMLPRPTAEPMVAKMNAPRVAKTSLWDVVVDMMTFRFHAASWASVPHARG